MNAADPREPIPGAGIDRDRRPGVPMETEPKPAGNAHWTEPERQEARVRVLKRKGLENLTPVFSNALPPRALSGLLRRAAYRVPEHKLTHWALLLLGDRIDVLEHRLVSAMKIAAPIAVVGAAVAIAPALLAARARRKPKGLLRALGLR